MAEISKTVDHALTLLEAVARLGPVTVAQLVRHLGVKRSAVFRGVETLCSRGYLRRTADGYILGTQLLSLAQQAEAALIKIADPVLKRLADGFGETFILTLRDGNDAVQVAQAVNADMMVRIEMRRGFRHPLFAGASGLAILAFLDPADIATVLRGAEDADAVQDKLRDVRAAGHAQSRGELSEGIQGLSVPLWADDKVIGSIGIIVNTAHTEKMLSAISALSEATAEISSVISQT